MKHCASCGGTRWKRGKVDTPHKVAGVVFEGALPAEICKSCGDALFDLAVLERFELGIAAKLATMGLATPEAFRFMRKALGLRGVDLASLLGVEPETISRWENGGRRLDRGAFAIVGGLVEDRAEGTSRTLARLEALAAPEKAPRHPVRVRLATKRTQRAPAARPPRDRWRMLEDSNL